MKAFFRTTLYIPLYNTLVFLVNVIPGNDMGIAIITLTLVVKTILLPLQHKQTKTQLAIKNIQGELKDLKDKHKDNKEKYTLESLELYKRHGINPFAGIVLMLIQIPILISLFFVFRSGISIDSSLLYSFVSLPAEINFDFLGLVDLTKSSLVLAILASLSQYYQISLSVPPIPKRSDNSSLGDDFARSMNLNMRYVMPVIIFIISIKLPSAIVLYWLTSNLFMIAHELFVRKQAKKLV